MSTRTKRQLVLIVLFVWVPLGLGCFLIGPRNNPPNDEPPPVDDEGCSSDHADYWAPDSAGAEIEQATSDSACNEVDYFSAGGGQSSTTFHIEPTFRVTNPQLRPTDAPSITWEVMSLDGQVLREQGVELYDEDIVEDAGGFSVTSRVLIGAEHRGTNVRVRGVMTVLDSSSGETSDAGSADAGAADAGSTSSEVELAAEAALYITP